MKVSINWARELCGGGIGAPELIELIGARLGAVDEVVDFGARYGGIVIVKVVECAPHPNADKLHVCKVDDRGVVKNTKRDSKGLVQIVCGAPNVRTGMLAAWIPPGVTVPSTIGKDPFVIEAKELRGVVSNGMLASAAELGFGEDHSGLLDLGNNALVGADFAKHYGLDDVIIDIENKMFTHRPDCFGQLGVTREIAGISHKKFASPGWYKVDAKLPAGRSSLSLEIKNNIPKLVPRFCAVLIEGVEVGPSPAWLQATLTKLGAKPINNIVDITNYMMLLTAQPMHAYDYDKLATGTLGVRLSEDGEELKLIGGKAIKLKKGAIVVTDGKKPVGLGGVMGGSDTEVSAETKNIVLETATFDMNLTRQSAFEYGLFTDAATRFTKGQSPLQNTAVITRAVEIVEQVAGGKVGAAADFSDLLAKPKPVVVEEDFVNSMLGAKLSSTEMARLLENVEFKVNSSRGALKVGVPFWRTDIEIPEDLVEEIGRLYGYEHLPLELPGRNIAPALPSADIQLKERLRYTLAVAGANEVLAYSFVSGGLLEKAGQDASLAYKVSNALSPDVQYYRLSLTPSLLDKVNSNIRTGFDEFMLFEIGKAHGKSEIDEDKLPKELRRLAGVVAAKKAGKSAPYFRARRYAEELAASFGYQPTFKKFDEVDLGGHKMASQMVAPFEPNRSAWLFLNDKLAGIVGEYRPGVSSSFKLPAHCAGFELFLSVFQADDKPAYQPLNRFPLIEQDICLRSSTKQSYQQLTGFIRGQLLSIATKHGYIWQIEPVDIYQKGGETKQTTWHITLGHSERTLTNQEANSVLDELAAAAKKELKAERV